MAKEKKKRGLWRPGEDRSTKPRTSHACEGRQVALQYGLLLTILSKVPKKRVICICLECVGQNKLHVKVQLQRREMGLNENG